MVGAWWASCVPVKLLQGPVWCDESTVQGKNHLEKLSKQNGKKTR
jgi:hypothetical protein